MLNYDLFYCQNPQSYCLNLTHQQVLGEAPSSWTTDPRSFSIDNWAVLLIAKDPFKIQKFKFINTKQWMIKQRLDLHLTKSWSSQAGSSLSVIVDITTSRCYQGVLKVTAYYTKLLNFLFCNILGGSPHKLLLSLWLWGGNQCESYSNACHHNNVST